MKPTCLTPGCTQETGHEPPHGDVYVRQNVPDYVATGPAGTYNNGRVSTADLLGSTIGLGRATGSGIYQRPSSTPVTLEGLAAVITACASATGVLGTMEAREDADADLLALIAKAREVACGKREMTAGEAVRAVHQRIAAMPEDELERHAEAIAARDDADLKKAADDHAEHLRLAMQIPEHPIHRDIARGEQVLQEKAAAIAYNRALHDALAALGKVFGPEWLTNTTAVHAKEALQRLFRSTP